MDGCTQPNLTLQQASDACVRLDTGMGLHLADVESAHTANGSNY